MRTARRAATALLDTNDIRPNWSLSGDYNWVANDKFFIGARGGFYKQDQYNEGIPDETRFNFLFSNVGLAGVPAEFQHNSGYSNIPNNRSVTRNIFGRGNFQVDGTYYGNFAGNHTLKGGVQFDRIANNVLDSEQKNLIRISWDAALSGQRGTYGYYQVRSNGVNPDQGFSVEGDIANTNIGLFIQDAWSVNSRLTLNLGLRTENESVPSYTTSDGIAPVAIEWGFSQKLAPRLGFAYDLAGDGKTKLYGNWGIYYDIFKLELPQGSFGGQKWLEYLLHARHAELRVARSGRLPSGLPGQAAARSDRLPPSVQLDRRRHDRSGHQADEAVGTGVRPRA